MTPNLHLWLIPLLPLIGAAINGLLGKKFLPPGRGRRSPFLFAEPPL